MKTIKRYLPFALPHLPAYLLGFLALVVVDTVQTLIPQLIRRAVDDLAVGSVPPLVWVVLAMCGIAILMGLARFVWRQCIIGVSRKIEAEVRHTLYRHILSLSMDFFHRTKTGEIMAHCTNDLQAVRMALGIGLVGLVDAVYLSLVVLFMMLRMNPLLTLYVLVPLPVLSVITFILGRIIYRRFRELQRMFADITEFVRETVSGVRVIKAFVQEDGVLRAFKGQNDEYSARGVKLGWIDSLFDPLLWAVIGASVTVLLFVGGKYTLAGKISVGQFVAFVSYIEMIAWPMIAMGWIVNIFQRGNASMDRIYKLLEEKPSVVKPEFPKKEHITEGIVEFKNACFAYNGRQVLSGINIVAQRGRILAVVGEVGSGKSTLVKLVPRLYDVDEGSVLVDGVDVREWDLVGLRRGVGFVPQDNFLFADTIRGNISFGNPFANLDDVLWALEMVELKDEVDSFSDGINTIVGERGVSLSGGQKQRVAIARALINSPDVIFADEPTGNLDRKAGFEIMAIFQELNRQGNTIILVTHEDFIARHAKKILELHYGKIKREETVTNRLDAREELKRIEKEE